MNFPWSTDQPVGNSFEYPNELYYTQKNYVMSFSLAYQDHQIKAKLPDADADGNVLRGPLRMMYSPKQDVFLATFLTQQVKQRREGEGRQEKQRRRRERKAREAKEKEKEDKESRGEGEARQRER